VRRERCGEGLCSGGGKLGVLIRGVGCGIVFGLGFGRVVFGVVLGIWSRDWTVGFAAAERRRSVGALW
jgi:hypothetical protein